MSVFEELNTDLWLPFSQAYADGDAERYLALHTADCIRVQADRLWVVGLEEYAARMRDYFATMTALGATMELTFRFLERLPSAEAAAERGVLRLVATRRDGKGRTAYGRFHTFSRRTPAGWRFVVDYDSSEGGTVGPAEFEAGHPVDAVAAFSAPAAPVI